jgi:hypothetical protein
VRFGLVWVVLGWDSGWGLRAWDFPTERVLGSPDPPFNSRAELRKIRVQGKTNHLWDFGAREYSRVLLWPLEASFCKSETEIKEEIALRIPV